MGATSDVGLSETSSAFDTRFVDRKYNVYGTQASVTNESSTDRTATLVSRKEFNSSYYDNLPLKVQEGKNDTFALTIDGNTYNIKIPEQSYTSSGAIVSALNTELSKPAMGAYAGTVTAG